MNVSPVGKGNATAGAYWCAAWRASKMADDSQLRLGRPSVISETRAPNASVLKLSPADEACMHDVKAAVRGLKCPILLVADNDNM
jgi:hypothetical protein